MGTMLKSWERSMIEDDCEYYLKEKAEAQRTLRPSDSLVEQKQKFDAIIHGDYWRAFMAPMLKGKEIPVYRDYKRHWLYANRHSWNQYSGIDEMCDTMRVGCLRNPQLEKGYTYVGKMWGLK